ncbi:DMT family transporter [Phreatobacter sp.]|uniref:DMT family transporter n=1 Tax=Phreatobacter sp. TaxID=1966341 RepID=UPI0022C9AA12|nr:DMT family transporter [Phreatobacter sp.]MCZ8314526.1 DMT family transporter [Phreatobacter sp.]
MLVRDFILLMGVCLIWATNFVVTKLVLVHLDIPPLLFSSLRFALVLLVALPWLLPWPRPHWRIVVVGLMMGAGGFGLVSIGLMTATPSSAAVVTQLGVPLTALLSVFMLGEKIGLRRGIGIALAFSGAVIVMYDPKGFSLSFGLLFVLGSAFASAFGVVLLKKTENVAPLQFQAWVGLASSIPLGLASMTLETGQVDRALAAGWPFLAALAYTAIAVSLLGHSLFFKLVMKYEANLISTLTLMCPLMGIGLGVLVTGDPFDLLMIAGTAVVLAGVAIILVAPKRRTT